MNQNRSLRYLVALIAVAGLFVGNSIGVVLDQAAAVTIDPALWLAFQACDYCVESGLPVLSNLVSANRWTLLGSLGGLGLGLLVGLVIRWFLRPRPAGPIRRLSGFRQASELARFSRGLTDTLDPQRILVQLHTEVMHVTGADCGSSFLLDPTSPEHRVAQRVGEGVELQRLNPMEAEAVVSGRSRSVQDFEADGEPPPHVGIRSALLVPITHEENAIGLIHLHSQQPAAFDSEFVDYVQVLAAQAAVAIHNAQRYEEQSRRSEALRQRVNQLQQLTQIPNTVRVDRPLAANLESIAQTMQDTAGFGFVLISVYQPAGNHLALATASGLAAPVVERLLTQPVPWERLQPFLREEFRSNRVFLVPHTQTAAVYTALDLDQPRQVRPAHVAGQWHPDDLLLVPLYSGRGDILGLISLSAPRDPETPQALVLEMLEVFASQTTLAIENAQALTQAEERLTESQGRAVQLGALTEVSGAIVGTLRAAEVIPVALDQLRRLIPYDSATFWKRDLNDNRWQLSGARSSHEDPERVVQRAERSQPTLFTEISATRGVVFVPDVTRDVRFSFKEASTMRSWLGVPVLSQGEVVGVLVLEKAEDNFYGAAQAPLALAFANRLAMALDNARLYEESVGHAQELEAENTRRALEGERRAQRLTLLNRIAGELAEARDQAAVLTSALQVLREALGADYAAGLLFETEVPHAVPYVVAQSRLPAGPGSALPLSDNPLLEQLAGAEAPLLVEVERATPDAALLRPESLAWVGPDLGAALFVPLAAEGRLAGLLGLGQAAGRRFTPGDTDLAWAVAQQAIMALQNLRLRERTQEQAVANQMVRALSRAADRPELYATLREQLSSVADLPTFTLALYDAERNHVSFPLIVEGAAGQTADLAPRPPAGLLRHLLLNRQPVRLSGDLAAEAQAQGLALTAGQPLLREGAAPAAAYLGVPLLLGERVLGALIAHQADPAAGFTDRHERLLAAAAGQTAVALDNLQLYEQARQGLAVSQTRTTELEALAGATVALAGTLRVADLVTVALDQLQRLLPYARAVVWLRHPHAHAGRRRVGEWHAAAVRQMDADRLADRLSLAAGSPLGDVLSTRRVSLVADTSRDTRFGGAARAWLGLPLAGADEVTGLIELESAAPGGFTAAHAAQAQAFATRAGAALENARQYEASLERVQSLDDQARRFTQLNQAALTLGGNLDLDAQLTAAARLLAETLNADQVQVVLWAADGRLTQTTALPAAAGAAATPAALAAAAPVWDRFRAEAAPPALTLAELRSEHGLAAEQLAWLGPQAATGLLLPLTTNGQTRGVAAIGWAAAEHAFTVAEVEAAQGMARLAAAALSEAAQYETAQQGLTEQATANLISRAISQAPDVPQLAALLREQIEAWLRPGELMLALYHPARHEVSFPLAVRGGQPQTLPAQPPSPLLHHLITSRQPLLLTGEAGAAQLAELGLPPDSLGAARSYLGLPLNLNDQVVGVLVVADPARADALTASHQRVLSSVGLQVAITLEHARLYSEGLARVAALDERAQRLAWLQQVNLELNSTLDVPQILTAALRQLTDVLLVDQAGALLFTAAAGAPATAQLLAHTPPETAPALLAPQPLEGHPLFDRVAESNRPLGLDDLPAEKLIRPEHTGWVGFELRSALFVPLVAHGRSVGLLGFGSTQPRAWSAAEVELASGAAQAAALAVANGQRYAEVQLRLSEQTTFSQVLRAISLAGDLDQLLEVLRARLAGWTGAENAYLALFDDTRNEVTLPLLVESGRLRAVPSFAPGGLLRHVLQTRHALRLAGDVTQQSQELGLPIHPEAGRPLRWAADDDEVLAAGAYLALPILLGEKVLGVLAVEAAAPEAAFTDAHERLLSVIAAQTAIVLENGRLYAQTRQALAAAQDRVAQLEALTTALSNVASVLYSEEVVSVALEQFRRVLPYDHATFWQREATAGSGRDMRWRLAGTRGYPEAEARQAFGLDNTYQTLFGELVVGRRPLLVADTSRDPRFGAGQPVTPRTWLGVPLVTQGEVIGILVLEKLQPNAYEPAQVAPAMILANQVTAVLTNARQFEENATRALELDERTRRLAFLNRFGVELANNLDLGSLMRLTLKAMTEAMGLEQATGAVFDETRSALLALEHYPEPAAGPRAGRAALPGNFLLERLQAAPTPITLEDVGAPEAHPRLLRQADWIGQEVGAAMFVPLVNNGSLIGLVGLGQSEAGRHFTPGEMELAQALANQAAAAVNQARLYERAQQRLAEQASINQMSRALARAVDLRTLGEQLRQQIEAWVDPESVYLAVYDEDRNEVSFPLAVAADQPQALAPRAPSGLVRHLLQRRQPLRLNGEITQQLKDQGILTTGLGAAVGLDDVAAFTSYLAVPLLNGERVAGAVLLGGPRRAEAFDESHERILSAVGAQLAAALDHTRQFERTHALTAASQSRAAQLNRVSTALNSTLEPVELFQAALSALAQGLDLDQAAAIVFDDSRAAGRLRPLVHYPATDVDQAGSLALTANPLLDQLRETLAPITVEDAAHNALVTPDLTAWVAPDLRSALFLPLVVAGKLIGLLGLGHTRERRRFTPGDIELAMTVANQAAIASHNAGLYQRTHRRLVELATISQTSRAISQTIDLRQLYETVRTQVDVALKADTLYLALYDEAADELTFPLAVEHGQAVELSPRAPDRLMRHILTTRQPLLLAGEIGAKLVELGLAAEGAPLPRAKAYLGVPLIAGAKVRGVLAVEDYRRAYAFTDKHEQSLLTIAAPIAAAVDGAALYELSAQKAQALNARAALLGRVSAELSETTGLDNLLRFTAQVIAETLLTNIAAAIVLDEAPEARLPLKVARYPANDGDEATPIVPGHPMLAQLQERLAPLPLDEFEADPALHTELRAWLGPEVVSALFLPLITGDKLIGLVAVGETNAQRRLTSGEIDLAMTLANEAAVAIANARLQQKVAPRLVELAAITRLCRALGQAVTLPQLSEILLAEIGATLKAETIYLALWDAPRNTLTFPLMFDAGQSLAARPQTAGGALRFILEQRQPLLLNGGVVRQLAARGLTYQPVIAGAAAPQSFLGVPLLLGSRVLGVLVVEDYNQVGKFGSSQETILTTVAAPIAVAVENALLQTERSAQASEIEERARQLALVNRLSVALMGALTPEAILQHTLDTLQSTFGVAHAAALRPLTGEHWAVVRPSGQAPLLDPLPTPAALLAQAAAAGQALTMPDLAAEHPLSAELGWLAPAPRALLLLPVRLGDELVGLVALAEDTARAFDPRAVELAVTCVNQAAIALENSRLYQQTRSVQVAVADQAEQFGVVTSVQQRITAAADLDAVTSAALAELPRLAPFDSATLWLRAPEAPGTLRAVAAQGNQRLGQTLNLSKQPVYAEVLAAGAVRVADKQADPRLPINEPSGGDAAYRSWVGVALGRGDDAAGVLVLEKAEASFYQPEHVTALQAVAGPLAARLAQTQQQAAALDARRAAEAEANRLALLQRVTSTVAQTLDLHSVLRGLLTELVALVPADQAAALLFADSADPAASHGLIFTQYPAQNTTAPLPAPGHPLLARLQTAEGFGPVVINDLAAEGVPPAQLGWLGVEPRSALLLPLVAGDTWLGVVGLGAAQAGAFTAERLSLAHNLTLSAGAAVQNALLHHTVARDLHLQVALNRLAPAFAGVPSLDQLAPALTAEAAAHFDAHTVYLALYDAEARQVSFPVLVEAGQPRAVRPVAPQGVIAHILQTRQPLRLAGDLAAQLKALGLPAAGSRARRENGDPSNAAAYLGAPVLIAADVAGVLAVEGPAFTAEHLTLLTALAEQVSQALQRLRAEESALARQARATHQFEQQLTARAAALAAWRDRYAALLAAHPQVSRPALEAALHQGLIVAGQAIGADYGVLYLNDAGRLTARAAFGSDAHLPAGDPLDLAGAVLRGNEPVIIGDLLADPRWGAPVIAAPAAEASPGPNGANGTNGHDPATDDVAAAAEATPEPAPAPNGQYHSSLAVPLGPNGAGPAGVLLFFSARPAAFGPEAVPVAAAAAGQLAYTLEHDTRLRAWQMEAVQLRDGLTADQSTWAEQTAADVAAAEAALSAPPTTGIPVAPALPVEPVGVETVRVVPAHREPVPALPVSVTPALGEPEPIVRAAPTPLWRRLAVPVGLVSVVLCAALALTAGPLRGLLGGSPPATPTVATATLPAAGVDTQAAATDTAAPATPTATSTTAPTEAPTATPTVEPTATVTAEPTASPTEPLPPDVLAVAVVTLPEGIVGRLRDAPNGNVISGVSNGTEVHVISTRQTTDDGIAWVRIRLIETGQTGWVGESLLTYSTPPPG